MDIFRPFDSQTQLLGKVLDLRAEKAKTISANIANAETPGYAPVRYEFEADLSRALARSSTEISLKTSDDRHIPTTPANFESVNGKVVFEKDTTSIGDENGVSVDQEMLALSENELYYETAAQLLKKKLTLLKHVISGGQ